MSNTAVGGVYAQIIDKIIAEAKNDFEEAGLDQETLQELKQQWRDNISKLHVAHCPWDPPPPQPQVNPPTLPSNVKPDAPVNNTPVSLPQQQPQPPRNGNLAGEPHIKQEPKYDSNIPNYSHQPNGYGGLNPAAARQRANQLLQEQFGHQANASIQASSMQQQQQRPISLPQQQQRPQHIQLPGQGQQRLTQQQYAQQHPSLGSSQTDGADDAHEQWSAILVERRARSEEDRMAADRSLRDYLEQSASIMDSGLMVPLSEHPSLKGRKRKTGNSSLMPVPSVAGPSSTTRSIVQMDGGDDDDDDKDMLKSKIEADEDAINSDLDDSDDELDNPEEEDQEGPVGETILCTYDKVQRVKNKWKCVLKDGILTTSGREYVFHKAQGEFEW